jgi:hypothetical protein
VPATEYTLSFARNFELWERRVSVGIKPKVVDLRAFTFDESILTVNAGPGQWALPMEHTCPRSEAMTERARQQLDKLQSGMPVHDLSLSSCFAFRL